MKKMKKLLAVALIATLALTIAPMMTAGAVEIEEGASSVATGDFVYIGTYVQDSAVAPATPIRWRVLSNNGSQLFLISEYALDCQLYHNINESVTWETSTIRSWLNGTGSGEFFGTAFTERERTALAVTNVVNDNNPDDGTIGGNNTSDRIFLLSIAETRKATLGFTGDHARVANATAYAVSQGAPTSDSQPNPTDWWLRSPGQVASRAARVFENGYVSTIGNGVNTSNTAVRPALNLDLSSVIFTSATSGAGAKSSATVGSGLISATAPTGAVKFTVQDTSLTLTSTDTAARTVKSGDTVSIAYSGATTGANNFVSAVIVNSSGTVLYYGKLSQATSGTASFKVPTLADLPAGTYSIRLYTEEANGDNYTDFASTPIDIEMTVQAPGPPYDVTKQFGLWKGSGNSTAIIDAKRDEFVELLLHDNNNMDNLLEVDPNNYVVTEGSTIITLKESYLKTLNDGSYLYRAVFTDGYAPLMLNVDRKQTDVPKSSDVPQTGDDSSILLPILALSLSTICILGAEVYRRRLKKVSKR